VPSEAVDGSTRGSLSLTGDLLGPTISGLERLLQIPTGCGEQNMIGLAPNVYVGKYLTSVGRLRPDLKRRISRNLLVGYGRELTYRHPDGSFSAFGTQDKEGSTWLTAFVLKTFAEVHALGLVSVDVSVLESAATWLISQQAVDGSFLARGRVIHQEMMGGLGSGHGHGSSSSTSPDESALTSYVTAALAKALTEVPSLSVGGLDDALQHAKTYLSGAAGAKRTYTKLLRIHALFLAGLIGKAEAASEVLALSESTGMLRHWTGSFSTAQDVELTGYGVLVLSLTESMGEAFEGARWLLKQRKASGGFHSTQDTIIALSALATYASIALGSAEVTVRASAAGGLSSTMEVGASNMDVLQSVRLPQPGAPVTIEASGSGTVLVVAEVVYNLPQQPLLPCYEVDVHWFGMQKSSVGGSVRGCVQPLPNCSLSSKDGMWIMSVGLFTGYGASRQSLEARRLDGLVKRYELGDSRVDLYLEEMHVDKETCIEFNVTREHDVRSLQAANSEVFEYYAPDRKGSVATSYAIEEYVAPEEPEPLVVSGNCHILSPSLLMLTLLVQLVV